jgi:hypothetical protein
MPSPPSRTASWRCSSDGVEVRVADRPVVLLTPTEGRVKVGLVMPVVDRVIDVSVQPASSCSALEEAARRSRIPASSVDAAARAAIREAAQQADAWSPSPQLCLRGAFGGIAFPLLAAAYDVGASAIDEVPRWAAPVLAARTVGEGARVAFGTQATRPVRRALVRALEPGPGGALDLAVLALGLVGAAALEPDRLARVLQAERVAHPPSDLPAPAELRAAQAVLAEWSDERAESALVEALLVEAAGRADGLRLLLEATVYARQLGDHGPSPLPRTLDQLHDVHRALMRTAVVPPEPDPRERAPERESAPAPRDPEPRDRERRRPEPPRPGIAPRALPPPRYAAPGPDDRLVPSSRLRALDGSSVGDLTFVLPHAEGDLHRWGRLLSNCLADFGSAALTGRSIIVGVQRRNQLTYAVELTPAGVIRQFSGRRNRPPRNEDLCAVIDALVDAGVVDVAAPPNRLWMQAAAALGEDVQAG